MLEELDLAAKDLNTSRQAVIKTLIKLVFGPSAGVGNSKPKRVLIPLGTGDFRVFPPNRLPERDDAIQCEADAVLQDHRQIASF